jgi:hypothetical protein
VRKISYSRHSKLASIRQPCHYTAVKCSKKRNVLNLLHINEEKGDCKAQYGLYKICIVQYITNESTVSFRVHRNLLVSRGQRFGCRLQHESCSHFTSAHRLNVFKLTDFSIVTSLVQKLEYRPIIWNKAVTVSSVFVFQFKWFMKNVHIVVRWQCLRTKCSGKHFDPMLMN